MNKMVNKRQDFKVGERFSESCQIIYVFCDRHLKNKLLHIGKIKNVTHGNLSVKAHVAKGLSGSIAQYVFDVFKERLQCTDCSRSVQHSLPIP